MSNLKIRSSRFHRGFVKGIVAVVALAGAGSTAMPAKAGFISITNGVLSATGTQILNTGVLIHAWNVNGNAAGTPTVNGIGFSNSQPGTIALSGFPASVVNDATVTDYYTTTDMDEIMGDLLGTNTATNGTVTFSGLSVGQLYRVQMLHHQDVDPEGARDMEVHFGTTAGPGSGVFSASTNAGRFTTTLFTADVSSQLFTIRVGANDRGILNGITLFAVPEPGSFSMLLLGGAFLWIMGRKRN